jgi:hypothetical protein
LRQVSADSSSSRKPFAIAARALSAADGSRP